eukprot:s198_g16.t1
MDLGAMWNLALNISEMIRRTFAQMLDHKLVLETRTLAVSAWTAAMGTPSGSKNQNLFMDRLLGKDVRSFDGGAYMGPGVAGADLHYQAQKERERLLEKAQRHEEVNEFRKATSEHKIEKSLTRVEKAPLTAPVVGPEAGPQAKKRIPTFVKLKSKDSFEDLKETKPVQEPDSKRQRMDDSGAGVLLCQFLPMFVSHSWYLPCLHRGCQPDLCFFSLYHLYH